MTDALDKHPHEPKDPAGNHFPEFSHQESRIEALKIDSGNQFEMLSKLAKRIDNIEGRIAALEATASEKIIDATMDLETRIWLLVRVWLLEKDVEGAMASAVKLHAVHAALERWFKDRCLKQGLSEADERVLIALHEALK